ncbi:uncharacterized protein [Clytia hemisphaerica]|uniref:uncharacterized protein n=1 Tax=Clytia hemisphaerica TaxID=252671 RepID=UPI0034D4BF97
MGRTEAGGMFGLFMDALTGWASMGPGECDGGGGAPIDRDIKIASGECALLEGCKSTTRQNCFEGVVPCRKCYYEDTPVNGRNIMRADFYSFDEVELRKCFDIKEDCYPRRPGVYHEGVSAIIGEMLDVMLLKGTSVADRYQGALFKNVNVPEFRDLDGDYNTQFCDASCVAELREGCMSVGTMRDVRDWCLTALDWTSSEIPKMKGPPSYILMLVAKLIEKLRGATTSFEPPYICKSGDCWANFVPSDVFDLWDGLDGALVAAACTSAMLTDDWFSRLDQYDGLKSDFGFAVQHSLWLAIYSGRLGISLRKRIEYTPYDIQYGKQVVCNDNEAGNYELATGSVFASLCVLFNGEHRNIHYHFRPEILSHQSIGCVEKTTGMAYVRPGDWVNTYADHLLKPKAVCIGGGLMKYGIAFVDAQKHTTVEITKRGVTLHPPSIGVSLEEGEFPTCQYISRNGVAVDKVSFGKCGLSRYGHICKWEPVW